MENQKSPFQEGAVEESEALRRGRLISRYVEGVIENNPSAGDEEDEAVRKEYKNVDPKTKADLLYQRMMAYNFDRQTETVQEKIADPYLMSEMKVLFEDEATKKLFSETYADARIDSKIYRLSETGKMLENTEKEIEKNEAELHELEARIFQGDVSGEGERLSLSSRAGRLSRRIQEAENRKANTQKLEGLPHTAENTDIVAQFQYNTLGKYREELEGGFISSLPSRKEIERKIMDIVKQSPPGSTKKGVFLVSEPGTGKTGQTRAIAKRLTGQEVVPITCTPRTNKFDLFYKSGIFPKGETAEEGTYEDYSEGFAGAWTGYNASYQKERVRNKAQVVELIEFPDAFGNTNIISPLKSMFSLKDGDHIPGVAKSLLPGRMIIASGNMGERHESAEFPEKLRREFGFVPVDYPPMTEENPETYEFMLSALMDKNGHIHASKRELEPAYKPVELEFGEMDPDGSGKTLSDGSKVIGKDEIVHDTKSLEHGIAYRLAYAVKAIQDSYVVRGGANEYINNNSREVLRYKLGDDDKISIAEQGGEKLEIGNPITLGDVHAWMQSFNDPQEKSKPDASFTEHIQGKLKQWIEQAKHSDKEKFQAVFDYFGLFDKVPANAKDATPLTPKDIGYLSPRVPRPLRVKKPQKTEDKPDGVPPPPKPEGQHVTKEVMLEDTTKILLKESGFGEGVHEISLGSKFLVGGERFSFVGLVEDENGENHGKLVGRVNAEDTDSLHRIFNSEEVYFGAFYEFNSFWGKEIPELKPSLDEFCAEEARTLV